MGKPTGFLEFERLSEGYEPVTDRLQHYHEFIAHLSDNDGKTQGARCMEIGGENQPDSSSSSGSRRATSRSLTVSSTTMSSSPTSATTTARPRAPVAWTAASPSATDRKSVV